jgi:uncharacterized protein involved in exopolysaccharide biosynthesis
MKNEMDIKESSSKAFMLWDYIEVFLKYKKLILISSLSVCLIVGFVVFFILDPIFLSSSTVKTASKSGSIAAGLLSASGLSGLTSDVAEMAGGGVGGTELALYENILTSRRCLEETILRFNLMEENHEKYMQDAVKNFRENTLEISKDRIAGTMSIGVFDKDPLKAKEINEFLISQLNKIYTEMNVAYAKKNREFVEARYLLARTDLKKAEDSLKKYQDIFGVAPDVIVKVVAQTEIQLEAEIKSEEVKLDILKKILSPDQAEIKTEEEKIAAYKRQLQEMNQETGDITDRLKIKGSPGLVLGYIRLQRDVEIQNKIIAFMLPLYEQAKIDEKKDTPTVLILDQPFVPERKTKPKRLTICLIAFSITGVFTYIFAFLYEKFKQMKYLSSNV